MSQHWRTMVSQPGQGPITPGSAHEGDARIGRLRWDDWSGIYQWIRLTLKMTVMVKVAQTLSLASVLLLRIIELSLLTKNLQCGIGRDHSDVIACSTCIHALVLNLRINDEKHLIRRKNMHPPFASCWKVVTAVLLQSDLGGRGASCSAVQPCCGTHSNWHILRRLYECRIDCNTMTTESC